MQFIFPPFYIIKKDQRIYIAGIREVPSAFYEYDIGIMTCWHIKYVQKFSHSRDTGSKMKSVQDGMISSN